MIFQKEMTWMEEQIAVQCAPLLAGLKPSNLLILPGGMEAVLAHSLQETGVDFSCLSEYGEKQVYLLFDKEKLMVHLTRPKVWNLLQELGYEGRELEQLLRMVSQKYTAHIRSKAEFPHELGLLLGYPEVDVKGFMEHKGKEFLYSGYWKVYGNVRETVDLFQKFDRAKEWMVRYVKNGYSIVEVMTMYYKAKAVA